MSNTCCFDMKIVGNIDNIKKAISYINSDYHYKPNKDGLLEDNECKEKHLHRVSDVDVDKIIENGDDSYSIMYGECAWSAYGGMLSRNEEYFKNAPDEIARYKEYKVTTIDAISKELNLKIEVLAEEPGMRFSEHYLVNNGEIIIDRTVNWEDVENNKEEKINWKFTI